ncbi:hypothetical protein ABZW10_14845 [Kitasatospora sp. NPDC004723]|uniref:hypothetical protein n=1 Tax=Kitasatospora sp. NPDC004723 TaxID=3154288 RepID=UPI0033BC1B38
MPAALTQDGETLSDSVIPVTGTVPVFVTVIRQYAVLPEGTVVLFAHGPGPPSAQSAALVEVQTSLLMLTDGTTGGVTSTVASDGGVVIGPLGPGKVAVTVFTVCWVTFARSQNTW